MARQIYSFTKIEKKRTNSGIIAAAMGAGTIAALVGLIAAAVLLKGNVPFWLGGCCLLTLIIGAGGFVLARSARKNDDTFGRFLEAGYILCAVSVVLHLLLFLTGLLAIII